MSTLSQPVQGYLDARTDGLPLSEYNVASNIVSINKPKSFSTRVKAALDANPTSVQLRHQNIHWYALGARLAQL